MLKTSPNIIFYLGVMSFWVMIIAWFCCGLFLISSIIQDTPFLLADKAFLIGIIAMFMGFIFVFIGKIVEYYPRENE